MLFNSYIFIFAFMPFVLFGYFALNHLGYLRAGKLFLLGGSWLFYGWWNPIYLPLLLGSIVVNYTIAGKIQSYGRSREVIPPKKRLMLLGVCLNVSLLAYYKYMDFFIFNVNLLPGVEFEYLRLALPLGISFFTLQQIAFIVDCYRSPLKERSPLDYALFVSFFPQLIAGPIVHHREIMPQFQTTDNRRFHVDNFVLGSFVFSIGLFKKVVIADSFEILVNYGFDYADTLSLLEAWLVQYSYTFQLYFDFSAYSDMAIGLALMFNIELPINFRSPYKGTNIINLWQRWHITLTRFINAYVYKPILRSFPEITFKAGMVASFLAMVVSGIWHGSAWTFVVFGALNGGAIVINHLWRKTGIAMPHWLGWFITFHFFSITLVIFRATNWGDVAKIYRGMLGLGENTLQVSAARLMGPDAPWFFGLAEGAAQKDQWATWVRSAMVVFFIGIVALAPNSMDLKDRFKPGRAVLVLQAIIFVFSVMMISKASEFLYFQF
jgi:D-alanyl-lipoteichoic acid acyltransferase DltB (MBOAT superfamily)